MRDTDNAEWDGRDHLGQIVSPGTYIMHIEANQFRSGKSFNDYAPVVVGVRSK
jgi:flagellar hook assembly protein FlgD